MNFDEILAERDSDNFELSPDFVDRLVEAHGVGNADMDNAKAKIAELSAMLEERESVISSLKAENADMLLRIPGDNENTTNDDDDVDDNNPSDVDIDDLFE